MTFHPVDGPSYATSADGTQIAFDRLGQGPILVVVGGMFCDRQTMRPLAEQLAQRFTVINYDRRGRGESGNAGPYAVDREVDDLAALIAETGPASLYGHSSGAGLAAHAAARPVALTRLVLHEPPWGPDDEASRRNAADLDAGVRAAIHAGRRADAIALFMADSGMPPDLIEQMSRDPKMQAVAPTMPYDLEVMGNRHGGTIPTDLVAAIPVPTLVITGGASPDFFGDTATRLTDLLPNGQLAVLTDQDHSAPADVVAPVVMQFLIARSEHVG